MPVKIKCAKCGKAIPILEAKPFVVPSKICALWHSVQIGTAIYYLCPECAKKYKVTEEYMGRPIIMPK